MLGGGIFVLPSVAFAMTGPSMWLAYVLAALLVLPAALSKSELATALPASGGSYVFIERCLGPMIGTIGGVGLAVSLILKAAFALMVLGVYLDLLVDVPAKPVALAVLVLVVILNLLGVEKIGRVQLAVVGFCFGVLTLLTLEGMARPVIRAVEPGLFLADGMSGLLATVGLVFFSYAGVTKVAAIAEEVRDPSRNLPRGMLISLLAMALLYAGLGWVIVRALPETLAGDPTPIASLAGVLHGPFGARVLAATAIVALAGMANAGILAASRFPFAMSRDRLLPGFLQRVGRDSGVPTAAVLATGLAMGGAIVFLDVVKIAKLCSSFKIAVFALNNVALIVLRESAPQWYRPGFRSPFYPWVQIFGILTGLALLVAMGPVALVGLGAGTALGLAAFFVYGRSRVSHLGVFRQLFPRPDLFGPEEGASGPPPAGPPAPTLAGAGSEGEPGGPDEAHTVVALFGHETSAESLVHLGATLADGRRMEVLRLQELPEHGEVFRAPAHRAARIASLERRVLALADERHVETTFEHVLSRDVRKTLWETARRQHSKWVVLEWRERRRGLVLRDPYSWLLNQLSANVAIFRDAGIRTVRRILVLAEPGPHDALVVRTADRLAGLYRARLTLGRFVDSSLAPAETDTVADYHAELAALCDHVEGSELLRGEDPAETVIDASARFDLLVLGAPAEAPLRRMLFASVEDRIADEAHCAVLVLGTPRHETHESLPRRSVDGVGFGTIVEPALLQPGLAASSKEELFAWMARSFSTDRVTAERIEASFWERERQQSTAIGRGVALPHATVEGVDRTVLGVLTLDDPVDYASPDGTEVDVVVCTVGPATDRTTHLHLLASMARLISKGELLEPLRAAGSVDAMREALRGAEARVRSAELGEIVA